MMRNLKLGTQLNISFALVLLVPIIAATVFSIVYYSNKVRKEAGNAIAADSKVAHLLYRKAEQSMNIADTYAQNKGIIVLLGLNLGEKIGIELSKSAAMDDIDMITVVDPSCNVMVRSHAPSRINVPYPHKPYLDEVFAGKSLTMTEVLGDKELEDEGFSPDDRMFAENEMAYSLTGISPIYDRSRENIIAAIIVRRILNNKPDLIKEISLHLKERVALFEHTRLIQVSDPFEAPDEPDDFVPPPPDVIGKVLESNQPLTVADIRSGGSISAYMPLTDHGGNPVGVLMVRTGVKFYLQTRNIAIMTFLLMFLVGLVLAFAMKTIIERGIVIPVRRLREEAEKIGGGEYGHTLEITSGDEIGELTESFNKMSRELRRYDQQSKEHSLMLEERVKSRTAELRLANDRLIVANTDLEDTLERLNPGVSGLIGNNKQQLGLVCATELVADVCDYTKLNMILGETLMGELMRKFFRESHKLLAQYRGMFDKTVGDQIVAIFGIPKDDYPASPLHPFDAVACASKMIRVSEEIDAAMRAAIRDNYSAIITRHDSLAGDDRKNIRLEDLKFRCRIGINTSNPLSDRELDRMRMVMMGAETYADYTAQGGAVIYAFRLESSGAPGHIHIGKNTKRQVAHVWRLEELPKVSLKGLGLQSAYRVMGQKSVFDSMYPKTKFYRRYQDDVPNLLLWLMNTDRVGEVRIREVSKISEYLDADMFYPEHLAGVYNLCMARALIAYGIGQYLRLARKKLDVVLFASWRHTLSELTSGLESFRISDIGTRIPDTLDADLAKKILSELNQPSPKTIEARIIAASEQFDQMVFDRTYLQTRSHEVMPAKDAIERMRRDGRTAQNLLSALESLMIAEEDGEVSDSHIPFGIPASLRSPDRLAKAIEDVFTPEQRKELVSKLSETKSSDNFFNT